MIRSDSKGNSIEACVNKGTITVEKSPASVAVAGGGILGEIQFYAGTGTIRNCYNTGNVKGTRVSTNEVEPWIGGIVGTSTNGPVAGTAYIINCYNRGTLGTSSQKGGIVGHIGVGTTNLSNNYWLSTCGASYGIGNQSSNTNAVKTTATKLKDLTSTLGSAYKADSNNINSGYPILSWQ